MFDGWSDVEFIEYGESVILGQGAVVLSSMIIGDHLLIKKPYLDRAVEVLQGLIEECKRRT